MCLRELWRGRHHPAVPGHDLLKSLAQAHLASPTAELQVLGQVGHPARGLGQVAVLGLAGVAPRATIADNHVILQAIGKPLLGQIGVGPARVHPDSEPQSLLHQRHATLDVVDPTEPAGTDLYVLQE